MQKEIVQIGDPILYTKCKKVTDIKSAEFKQFLVDLKDTCLANSENGAGLSAPQIGGDLSVCICRRIDLEEKLVQDSEDENDVVELPEDELWEVMINPEIISKSEKTSTYWEGCLSIGVGKNILYGPVDRPRTVTIKYTDLMGVLCELKCQGFFSHVVQHEIDHLNGILFLSYVANPQNIWRGEDLDEYLAKHKEFPEILE